MKYIYSESAQLRIAKQGAAAIIAFIEELSPAAQERIFTKLPPVPGFRKKGPALVKKQRELLANAISHVPDDNRRPKTPDWMAFGAIWSIWGRHKFTAAFPIEPFDFADTSSEEALDFVRALVEKCNSNCAREDIERLVLFSGLPTTEAVDAFIARLPLRVHLKRDQALAKLPEEVAALRHQAKEIELNVGQLANELRANAERVEKVARDAQRSTLATEALQGNLAELEKRLSSSSTKELLIIADKVASYSKQVDAFRKDYQDARRTLEAELNKKHHSLEKHVKALTAEIAEVRGNITTVVQNQQLLAETFKPSQLAEIAISADDRTARDNKESAAHLAVVWVDFGPEKEAKRLEKIDDIFQLTLRNVVASGIRQNDADGVARTIVPAMIAGQLLQCSGSLADVLGDAAAASFGRGKVLSWQVPLGLCSTAEADSVQDTATNGAAGSVMLRGINRSAFEIYGTGIRDIVVSRHLQRQERGEQLTLVGTYAEGPATLSVSTPLAELGPLVDTDTLAWGATADWRNVELGTAALEPQQLNSAKLGFNGEIDEIHRLVDALGTSPSKMWRLVFSRFINILFVLPGANFDSSMSVALRAWILPWAKAKGLGRVCVEDAIRASATEQLNVPVVRSALDDLPSDMET